MKAQKTSPALSLTGLPPIVATSPRLLILGSMPSARSLSAGEYYAHPQNAFWAIMRQLLNLPPSADYAAQKTAVMRAGVVLWDVLATCQRRGSLDSAIVRESENANDIAALLVREPSIVALALNGGKARQCFKRHVDLSVLLPRPLEILFLPSTSAANARMSFEKKLAAWQQILPFLQNPIL